MFKETEYLTLIISVAHYCLCARFVWAWFHSLSPIMASNILGLTFSCGFIDQSDKLSFKLVFRGFMIKCFTASFEKWYIVWMRFARFIFSAFYADLLAAMLPQLVVDTKLLLKPIYSTHDLMCFAAQNIFTLLSILRRKPKKLHRSARKENHLQCIPILI